LLLLATINQKTAPVDVRERFAFTGDELPRALERLKAEFGHGLILSTCNRTEIYLDVRRWPDIKAKALAFLRDVKGLPPGEFDDKFRFLQEAAAVRHLFAVAAGTESQVVGETEILGQVRAAFVTAVEADSCNLYLSRLFHRAIRVGRRARSETAIGRHGLSISATAVALARRTLGDLSNLCVLVISAGEAGKLTAQALRDCGINRMLVTSRKLERAQALAGELDGEALPLQALPEALARADIVITSSGSPSFLIDAAMLRDVMARRDGRELVVIDIAVPRDVEPAAREIDRVHLFDIDDLQSVAESNRRRRLQETDAVDAIIDEEARRFLDWARSLRSLPTIAAIRHQAEALRAVEVARTLARLPDLSEEEQRRIEALSRALVKKLLHSPIARLKSPEYGHLYVRAARELFDIDNSGTDS